jgi:hypothetical protein
VKRLKAFWEILKRLAGVTARHNRALRAVNDWTGTVVQFFQKYQLSEDTGTDKLLANSGDAKFELTAIVHQGRLMADMAGKIRHKQVPRMIIEIVDSVESIRRYLINPKLQKDRLSRAIVVLRSSLEELQKLLAEVEYL